MSNTVPYMISGQFDSDSLKAGRMACVFTLYDGGELGIVSFIYRCNRSMAERDGTEGLVAVVGSMLCVQTEGCRAEESMLQIWSESRFDRSSSFVCKNVVPLDGWVKGSCLL
jgi:hypothetical protein